MLVLDTSGLLAAIAPEQPQHKEARDVLLTEPGPLLLSPYVLAEVDYMLLKLGGVRKELQFLRDVGEGGYEMVQMTVAHFRVMKPLWGDAFTILPADAD